MKTTRWISVCAAGALLLGACGSDGDSAADTTTAESDAAAVTSASDNTATSAPASSSSASDDTSLDPDTTGATTDQTSGDTTDQTSGDTTDQTSGDTTDQTGADVSNTFPQIDEIPVCQAFTRIALSRFLVGSSGLAPDGEATVSVERREVVAYAGSSEDLATLRRDIPAELAASLEPFFSRIDAADDSLIAGGFSADEVVAIGDAWNAEIDKIAQGQAPDVSSDPSELLDQTKLDAAEAAFLAAVGSYDDFEELEDASDMDEEGEAWLAQTCPLLSESSGGG